MSTLDFANGLTVQGFEIPSILIRKAETEVELKEKIENRIKTGGLEWGVSKGQIVVSLVSKRFIRFELPNFTRYGESKSLDLEPGTYRLTCVGFVPEGGFRVEKALKKGAYFNLDILTFTVNAGQTTTLEVHPVIHKTSTFFVKFFRHRTDSRRDRKRD